MAYIGKQPLVGNYQVLDALTATTTATYALTKDSVAVFPQTPANCIVSLNGVIQAPFDSYTISGSNIVFASALTGSDSIDFITVLGDVLNVGTVSDGTIGLAKLSATGTKDATTFLRGDNTFATPAGGTNTPAFEVYLSATQTLTNNTATKIQFNTEVFDTASAYDNATNYRFTVPTGQGGRYFVYNNLILYDGQNAERIGYSNTYVYKNGSEFADYYGDLGTTKAQTSFTRSIGLTMDLSAGDYIEIFARIGNTAGGSPQIYGYSSSNYYSNFGAYKIIE